MNRCKQVHATTLAQRPLVPLYTSLFTLILPIAYKTSFVSVQLFFRGERYTWDIKILVTLYFWNGTNDSVVFREYAESKLIGKILFIYFTRSKRLMIISSKIK